MLDLDGGFDHERLELFHDDATGVTGALAIHSTRLGPAMGGLRLRAYPSLAGAADDALRLAKAMTLKNAAAGLDLGGGKAVLIDDGGWDEPAQRSARMRAVGRIVDELAGRYVTAEDVGTSPDDMEQIAAETRWVAGRPVDRGGRGDPSPRTALTVAGAIRAAARQRLGAASLSGIHVGVQGVGHVGAALVELLSDAGAHVTLTDADPRRAQDVAERHGAEAVIPDAFVTRELDVLAPCALGEVIDETVATELRCAVVAGAANNPLTSAGVASVLARRGILYVPDFLANCGGIIHVGAEPLGLGDDDVDRLLAAAIKRTEEVLREALATDRTPWSVAVAFAEARMADAADTTLSAA